MWGRVYRAPWNTNRYPLLNGESHGEKTLHHKH